MMKKKKRTKGDFDGRSFVKFASDGERAVVGFDYLFADRNAEPGASDLGGKEGFLNVLQGVFTNSATGIGNEKFQR